MSGFEPNSVLVNGARGILGRIVLDKLGVKYANAGMRSASPTTFPAILVDSKGNVVASELKRVHTIINCAGRVMGSNDAIQEANVEHAVRLAAVAKSVGVNKFVQVSSFSIFGKTTLIDETSQLNPFSEYGKSKRDAEVALNSLADKDFTIVNVRFPFMFGLQNPSLMGKLIKILNRAPIFPLAQDDVYRSMLTYTDAATLLVRVAAELKQSGSINLADPTLFKIQDLVQLMRDNGLKVARTWTIPNIATSMIKATVPSVGDRILTPNILSNSSNWAADSILPRGIFQEVDALLKKLPLQKK